MELEAPTTQCPQKSAHVPSSRVYTRNGFIHQVHWLCHFIPKILQMTFHIQRCLRGVTHQLPEADVVYTELMMTIRELDTGYIHSAAIVGTSNTTCSSGRWIRWAVVIGPVSYCELPFQVWEFIKLMMQCYKSSQWRFSFPSNNHFDLPSILLIVSTPKSRMVSILQSTRPNLIITCVLSVNFWLLAFLIQYFSNIGVQWRSVTT